MLQVKTSGFGLRAKMLFLLTLIFVSFIGFATFKAFTNFETIIREKQAEFEFSTKWIESEQHRHLALARMVAFMAMNRIDRGLNEEVCSLAVCRTYSL